MTRTTHPLTRAEATHPSTARRCCARCSTTFIVVGGRRGRPALFCGLKCRDMAAAWDKVQDALAAFADEAAVEDLRSLRSDLWALGNTFTVPSKTRTTTHK